MNRQTFFAIFIAGICSIAAPGQEPTPNDQARFLAGLPVRDSQLEHYTRDSFWAEHASALDAAWSRTEQRQISPVRQWARTYLGRTPATVFYMFSGPDFLYANAFFPAASTTILCGTEPIGAVPDISRIPPEQLGASLSDLRASMKTMLSFHYFITKEMRVDLQRNELGGTLPILYVFLARLGHTVREVTFVKTPAPGVRITFAGRSGTPQTLYYFKVDLSNGSSEPFLAWCRAQGPGASLVTEDFDLWRR